MKFNAYLDSVVDSENKQLILFTVYSNGKRARISSGIKVVSASWNGTTIIKNPGEPFWNDKLALLNVRMSVLNRIKADSELNLTSPGVQEIKEMYKRLINKKASKKEPATSETIERYLFRDLVTSYKEKYKNVYSISKLRQYNQTVDAMERFKPGTDIRDINQTFLVKYCEFLVNEGKENSTIKYNHIKNIKNIAREAKMIGITVTEDVANFSWKSNNKQVFVPTKEEVEAIYEIDDLEGMRMHIRDAFIFTCDTGLRDSDFRTIRKEFIYKQKSQWFLRVSMQKTGLDYSIPLTDRAYRILKKYDFAIPVYSQKSFNKEIKIIIRPVIKGDFIKIRFSGPTKDREAVPRYKMFTTHTGRRYFGRNWIDAGGASYVLMLILGHSSFDTTLRYISYQPEEITEAFKKVMG